MKNLLYIAIAVFAVACTAGKSTTSTSKTDFTVVTDADVQRIQSKYADASLDRLNSGKKLFEAHCGDCHGLAKSYNKGETTLNNYVPGMCKKVNGRKGAGTISDEGVQEILQYLVTINTREN